MGVAEKPKREDMKKQREEIKMDRSSTRGQKINKTQWASRLRQTEVDGIADLQTQRWIEMQTQSIDLLEMEKTADFEVDVNADRGVPADSDGD